MRNWLRDLDEHTAALDHAIGTVATTLRQVADDPERVEGEVRQHLRNAARLVEKLGESQRSLIAFNRRSQVRFAFLSLLFGALIVFHLANLFIRYG